MSEDPTSGPGRIILVGGGVRSGKSAFALARARRWARAACSSPPAQALDVEMAERIAAHVRTRGADFRTVEEPLALPEALRARRWRQRDADVVVVDCLTLWLSNLLLRGDPTARSPRRSTRSPRRWRAGAFHAIVVTNEVGLGIVPEAPLGRAFRDVPGARTSAWPRGRRDLPGDPGDDPAAAPRAARRRASRSRKGARIMSLLEATCARIREPDSHVAVEMQRLLDDKTKPRGSLGRLEELACQIAAIRGDVARPPSRRARRSW